MEGKDYRMTAEETTGYQQTNPERLPDGKALEVIGVSKRFYGVQALVDVSLDLRPGEVLGLVGENGAGKSTLIKILAGAIQADEGQLLVWDSPYSPKSPADAWRYGIAVIYQDRQLMPSLPVSVNIFLHQLPVQKVMGVLSVVDKRSLRKKAVELLGSLGVDIDPEVPVGHLNAAEKQLVDIAKALSANARILIMDEPTASLEVREVDRLFQVVSRLKERGTSVIFVSHRMEEIFEIADRVTVLRDGQLVGTLRVCDTTPEEVVALITGRELGLVYPKESVEHGETALILKDVMCGGIKEGVSVALREGEILGVTGLLGSGASELVNLLGGKHELVSGEVRAFDRTVHIRSPRDTIGSGTGFIPEDRKSEGLVENLSVEDNIILPSLDRVCRYGFISRRKVRELVDPVIKALQIKTPSPRTAVKFLSGGNQQKVVIGRWLASNARILALNQPTHGIDVGAKSEVHKLMGRFVKGGGSIVFVSSEIPEIMGLSDNVMVFHRGRVAARLRREEFNKETLMAHAMGVRNGGNEEGGSCDHAGDLPGEN